MTVPKIIGTGWAVPDQIRTNDDPIFDWLKQHDPAGKNLFTGYKDRRVLGPGESIDGILRRAAADAIAQSGVPAAEIDLVLGTASVSPSETPNDVAALPAMLGLPPGAWVLPLGNDFSNFNAGLVIADAMIRAGRARHALILCAGNWTRYVDYHTPQSVSASDGAGAAVVAASEARGFSLVDSATLTDAGYFGSMFMRGEEVHVQGIDQPLFTRPTFHITEKGQEGFKSFGVKAPPLLANDLLKRHGLHGADVALISHQASAVLIDAWRQAIEPGQYLTTLEQFANLTVANIPLNLAYFHRQIEKEWLLLLAIGIEMHTNAVLLRR
jgi:3-oxoacyl-[acyl-carrier-protein] synthase-3